MDDLENLSPSDGDPEREISFTLRSQCLRDLCPMGNGLHFKSRISPSPRKSNIRSRKRTSTPTLSVVNENQVSKTKRKIIFEEDDIYEPQSKSTVILSKAVDSSLSDDVSFKDTNGLSPVRNKPQIKSIPNGSLRKEVFNHKGRKTAVFDKEHHIGDNQMNTDINHSRNETFISGNEFFALQDSSTPHVTSDYSSGSNTPSKLKESTRRLTLHKSLNRYISYSSDEELEEWWERDKTDYTYSSSLSYREKVTPDRQISSPNMSRRGLKSFRTGYSPSPPFSQTLGSAGDLSGSALSLRSRQVPRGSLSAFSDESDEDLYSSKPQNKSSQYASKSQTFTTTTWKSKSIMYGFDDEMQDESPKTTYKRPSKRDLVSTFEQRGGYTNGNVPDSTSPANQNSANKSAMILQNFAGKIKSNLSNIWCKCRYLTYMVCTYLALWSFTFVKNIKKLFSKINQRSRKLDLSQNLPDRISRNRRTSTVVQSKKRTFYSISQNAAKWYKSKREMKPWLWWWLPVCLLLALLICLLHFFLSGVGPRSYPFSSSSNVDVASHFDDTHSKFLSHREDLLKNISVFWRKSCEFAFLVIQFLWNCILYIFNLFGASALWLGNSLTSQIKVNDEVPSSSETEQQVYFYGFRSIIDASSFIYTKIHEGLLSLWEYFIVFLTNGANLLMSMFSVILLVLKEIWILLGNVFLLIKSLVFMVIDYCIFAGLEMLRFIQYCCHAFISILLFTPNDEVVLPSKGFEASRSLFTQEQIDQIVTDPKIFKLMSVRIEEMQRNLNWSQHKLDPLFKEAVEAEVQRIRKEIASTVNQLKIETFTEMEKLQKQQESINLQLNQIASSHRDFDTKIEGVENSNRESAYSFNNLKLLVDDIDLNVNELKNQVNSLKDELDLLIQRLNSCCDKSPLTLKQVEEHVSILLTDLIGMNSSFSEDNSQGILSSKLGVWMNKYFVAKEEMESTLEALWSKREREYADAETKRAAEKQSAEQIMNLVLDQLRSEIATHQDAINRELKSQMKLHEALQDTISEVSAKQTRLESQKVVVNSRNDDFINNGITESQVRRIVNQALNKYDADKTGLVDHALESAGGSIVSTRCTEEYQGHQAELTIFGYSVLRYSTNTPRSIIQPDRMPGQCYAFKGSQGYIVILLAGPVRITSFSVEHIPRVLTPNGTIDSAPREFSVYGLHSPEEEGVALGTFSYNETGEPLQYFPVVDPPSDYFKFVELKIHSNHGNINYTCIYRFRVHGVRL